MNDEMVFLQDAITEALSARHPSDWAPPEDGTIVEDSWKLCAELGWDHAGLPEDLGGLGHGVAPLVLLARACGQFRLPLALPETALARWAISAGGLEQPAEGEVLTTPFMPRLTGLEVVGDGADVTVTGHLRAVPWARQARWLAAPSTARTLVVVDLQGDGVTIAEGMNIAGEARDDVSLDGATAVHAVGEASREVVALLPQRAVLLRSAQIAGALGSALALTREHTSSRKQFGRPLAAFQLVGAHIAEMTAQIALTDAMLQDAIHAHDAGRPQPATASLMLAASHAAAEVSRSAHQCHGAIGATREYQLHQFTRRLWSWRGESGSERYWNDRLGEIALAEYDGGLWAATAPSSVLI